MRHVLVIEDQFLIRRCLADMVVFAGASSVETVDSATAAIEAARRHPPSIIISDVNLKEGGRGPDAIARIRAMCGTVPVIFVTAEVDDPDVKVQATAILAKPCTADQFARTFAAVSGELAPWQTLSDRQRSPTKRSVRQVRSGRRQAPRLLRTSEARA